MKSLSRFFVFFALLSQSHAEQPFVGDVKEVGIVAESANKSGEKLVVRELKVQPESETPGNAVDRRYYRFEFWTHKTLFYAETIWKTGSPHKMTMKWIGDSECEITIVPDWQTMTFYRDKSDHWSHAQRID